MDYNVMIKRLTKLLLVFGIIAVLALLFRVWVLFFVCATLFVAARILLSVLRKRKPEDKPKAIPPVYYAEQENSVEEQITDRIKVEFPNAKWVWAQPDTQKRIEEGEDVFIILNGAGGYRRAKIGISDGAVENITIILPKVSNTAVSTNKTDAAESTDTPTCENYGLVAFEWVDKNILKLNERINEAIGQGETEYMIHSDELPTPNSYECVCEELKRAGLTEVECVEDGIKIKIKQQEK